MADEDDRARPSRTFWLDLLGAQVRMRSVDGRSTRSIEAGAGEPLILLHGISGHAETWVRNVGPFSDRFRVYALDMLGHGFTAKPQLDYTIEVLADHVLAFMDSVDAPRAHLVGQSLGGWVAGWMAVHHPDRVASLVSVTGAGLQLTTDGADLTARVGQQVRDATIKALEQPTREKVRTRLEWLVHDPTVVTEELVEVRYRIYSRTDFAAVASRLVEGLTVNPRPQDLLTADRLGRISCPTLVLWTQQNPTMPWAVGKAASEVVPGAAFHLMNEAGHWPQFEKPEEFHRVVLDFLSNAQMRLDGRDTSPAAVIAD